MCITLAVSVVEAAGYQFNNVMYTLYTIIGVYLGNIIKLKSKE